MYLCKILVVWNSFWVLICCNNVLVFILGFLNCLCILCRVIIVVSELSLIVLEINLLVEIVLMLKGMSVLFGKFLRFFVIIIWVDVVIVVVRIWWLLGFGNCRLVLRLVYLVMYVLGKVCFIVECCLLVLVLFFVILVIVLVVLFIILLFYWGWKNLVLVSDKIMFLCIVYVRILVLISVVKWLV